MEQTTIQERGISDLRRVLERDEVHPAVAVPPGGLVTTIQNDEDAEALYTPAVPAGDQFRWQPVSTSDCEKQEPALEWQEKQKLLPDSVVA